MTSFFSRLWGALTDFSFYKSHPEAMWKPILFGLGVCFLLLAVMHFVPRRGKRGVIVALTFLAGAIYALEYFWPTPKDGENPITASTDIIGNVLQIVMGFTFLLGIYNLVHIHFNNIRRARTNWSYSVVFFIAFITMTVAAFWRDWYLWFGPQAPPGGGVPPLTLSHLPPEFILDRNLIDDPALRTQLGLPPIPESFNPLYAADLYTFLFRGLYVNLEATMFSILAFYIASAAYRAFRVRNAEAGLMMITAVILMAGQVPLGMALTNWIPADGATAVFRIENFSYWVLNVINGSVQRAIDFGLGLGALAMSLRIWLSLERGTYFGQEV